jgi:hypothetical protein
MRDTGGCTSTSAVVTVPHWLFKQDVEFEGQLAQRYRAAVTGQSDRSTVSTAALNVYRNLWRPSSVGSCGACRFLILSQNQLSGSIPSSIGSMAAVQ